MAHYVGDSFYLAKLAKSLPQQTIVLCGVEFMGESASCSIPLRPCRRPGLRGLSHGAHGQARDGRRGARRVRRRPSCRLLRQLHSRNQELERRVRHQLQRRQDRLKLPQQHVLFIPDQNLGRFVAEQVPQKHVILNKGYCPRHHIITVEQIVDRYAEATPTRSYCAHPRVQSRCAGRGRLHRLHRRHHQVCRGVGRQRIHHRDGPRRGSTAPAPPPGHRQKVFTSPRAVQPTCVNMDLITLEKLVRCRRRARARCRSASRTRLPTRPARRSTACSSTRRVRTMSHEGKSLMSHSRERIPVETKQYPDMECDVVIAGCGVAGLYAALNLPTSTRDHALQGRGR